MSAIFVVRYFVQRDSVWHLHVRVTLKIAASIDDVPLYHSQRLRPRTMPNAFLLPLHRSFSSLATPLHGSPFLVFDDVFREAAFANAVLRFMSFGLAIFCWNAFSVFVKYMPMVLGSTAYKLNVFLVLRTEIFCFLVRLALRKFALALPRESCAIALSQGIVVKLVRPKRWNVFWRVHVARPERICLQHAQHYCDENISRICPTVLDAFMVKIVFLLHMSEQS